MDIMYGVHTALCWPVNICGVVSHLKVRLYSSAMVSLTLRCRHCQSERLVRNGSAPDGC
jgi:hypothetical protein